MNYIFYAFAAIIALFALLLGIKELFKLRFCVICASVSLTWFGLLVLYWAGKFSHPALIALLLGQSIVGVYYLFEKKAAEKFHLFRLPFLLTLTLAGFALLGEAQGAAWALVLLGGLWIALLFAYFYRERAGIRGLVKRLIACCRDW